MTALASDGVNVADELFFKLDGRLLNVRDAQWRVEVYGVHSSTKHHWVQMNLCGPVERGLTVRADGLDATRILDHLSTWLEGSTSADVLLSLPAFG